jgi:hypothetical protein
MGSSSKPNVIRWSHNRGRNGWDIPTEVSPDMSTESLNVDIVAGALGRKRKGSATQTFTGDAFSGYDVTYRFVPAAGEAAAVVMIVSYDSAVAKIVRVAAGTAAVELTLANAVEAPGQNARFATLNGKAYIAFNSDENRLHVYDPALSTTVVRRSGLPLPAAPTMADVAGAVISATLRYYRIQWRVKVGSVVQRQGLLGTAGTHTPAGTAAAVRITKPSASAEGETHWAIYGSADGTAYYEVAEVAVGTTTYDDATEPAAYATNFEPAPDEGAYTPFPSVKSILSTGERLVGFGVYESSAGQSVLPKNGRVYFTPVLDSSDSDDDERLSNTIDFQGWIDVGRNSGAEDRALAGPLDDIIFVFQSKGVFKLVPTGDASQPYRRIVVTPEQGAVSQESTFVGEDEQGHPCVYWLDPVRGPYRYGRGGLQWCGYDVQDLWATVNLAATERVAAGLYDPEQRAVIFGLATTAGAANGITEYIKFFVREGRPTGDMNGVRGGWVRMTQGGGGDIGISMAMLPETIGATMSRTLKPYFGARTPLLRRWNDDSATQDGSSSFQAYVTSAAWDFDLLHVFKQVGVAVLQAVAASAVSIRQTLSRNFGYESRTADVLLTAEGSQTRIIKKIEGTAMTEIKTLQVTLGDSAAANTAWTLDEYAITLEGQDEL